MKEKEQEQQHKLDLERMKIETEQQKLRVQTEEAVQLEKMINGKLRTETEKKLENKTIKTAMFKSKSAICLPKLE